MRARLRPRRARNGAFGVWLRYLFGRLLQVTGLLITLVAATAFFGSDNITAMLKMMLAGVGFFLPGWLLARKNPRAGQSS